MTSSVWRDALRQAWTQADRWQVGLYCLMPDHVHLFCAPNTWPMLSLRRWVAFWKSMALRHAGQRASIWQENFWDTQIRDHAHYVKKTAYVRLNPVRKELVANAEEWPFTGELNVFRW